MKEASEVGPTSVLQGLVKRWAFFDKSYSIADIKKDMKRFIEAISNKEKTVLQVDIRILINKNHASSS